MPERNYYVLCDDNCRFPSMTKEQIYDAIAEATGMTPTPVDQAFITKIKEQNAERSIKVWVGTEAQYNALTEYDSNTIYFVGTRKFKSVDELEEAAEQLYQAIVALQSEIQPLDRGGTGATTAANARANLGLSGAETKTLLWENASPTSNFANQQIDMDLSGYDSIYVVFRPSKSVSYALYARCDVGMSGQLVSASGVSGHLYSQMRVFAVSETDINFYVTYNPNLESDTAICIPTKIYGIKEV